MDYMLFAYVFLRLSQQNVGSTILNNDSLLAIFVSKQIIYNQVLIRIQHFGRYPFHSYGIPNLNTLYYFYQTFTCKNFGVNRNCEPNSCTHTYRCEIFPIPSSDLFDFFSASEDMIYFSPTSCLRRKVKYTRKEIDLKMLQQFAVI